jgi:hypothetical protein
MVHDIDNDPKPPILRIGVRLAPSRVMFGAQMTQRKMKVLTCSWRWLKLVSKAQKSAQRFQGVIFFFIPSYTHTKFLCSKSLLCWNRACVGKFCVAATQICVIYNTSFCVMTGFPIQSLSFYNTKISTQARFQHKSDFEHKSFKSVPFSSLRLSKPYATNYRN